MTEPPKGEKASRHLWLLDVRTRQARQFTNSAKSEMAGRWSPDGRWLAFVSDRGDKLQLYVMPADGGEAMLLADQEVAEERLEWSPDGRQIAFVAKEPKTPAEETREKEKDDARVVDRDDKPGRLFIADVASKKARLVTPAPWKVPEAQWLPQGDRIDGTLAPIVGPSGPVRGIRVSADGRNLAYLGSPTAGPEPGDLFLLSLTSPGAAPRDLTADGIDRTVDDFAWARDGSLVALVEAGVSSALYAVSPDGKSRALRALPVTADEFVPFGPVETIAFVGEKTTEAPEIWIGKQGGTAERVTRLNESWKAIPLAEPEILRYPSFDGTPIEGLLLRPPGSAPGKKVPLVVLVHGGPTGRWEDRFEAWGQLLAARGCAVFYPNVRGSTGYGARFMTMNRGDWGGADFKDLMAGVDLLVARGLADPDRLGIGGWSYGGFMAMWAVTQTKRFKAAVAGAGLSDLMSEFGTEGEPAYDEWFYGLPYETPEGFLKSSPITYVRNGRTPTLILQGEADAVDPAGQSREFYRALKRYGVVSDLVLYPREGHGFKEEKHRLDVLTRVVAWFEKYLK